MAGLAPIEFGNIDATYPCDFAAFSPQRLFTALESIITDVSFFLPGTNTPGVTSAFGAIFTDVDVAGSSIEYFDTLNASLGSFAVPFLLGNETFSFLGVVFDSAVVSRVRITSGNTALGLNATDNPPLNDVVAMDDFIYAETTAPIPEPATLVLVGAGLAVLRSTGAATGSQVSGGSFRTVFSRPCGKRKKEGRHVQSVVQHLPGHAVRGAGDRHAAFAAGRAQGDDHDPHVERLRQP